MYGPKVPQNPPPLGPHNKQKKSKLRVCPPLVSRVPQPPGCSQPHHELPSRVGHLHGLHLAQGLAGSPRGSPGAHGASQLKSTSTNTPSSIPKILLHLHKNPSLLPSISQKHTWPSPGPDYMPTSPALHALAPCRQSKKKAPVLLPAARAAPQKHLHQHPKLHAP